MKYTPEMIQKICDEIKSQRGRVRACNNVGIAYETFTEWMKKTEFSEAIEKAEQEANDQKRDIAIVSILKAMDKSWQAAAWWLERNFPKDYALHQKTEITGQQNNPIVIIKMPEKNEGIRTDATPVNRVAIPD